MSDIAFIRQSSYLVTGFFTPDYREIAKAFSENLKSFETPHYLYSVPDEEWQKAILMKPSIVLRARNDYPLRTLVLMDVDCKLRGDIGEWVEAQTTDIVLPARIRRGARRHGKVLFSSRVMVIAPTIAAGKLIAKWDAACMLAKAPPFGRLCDERELVGAIGTNHGATIAFTPDQFAGLDIHNAPSDAVIVHASEHAKRHDGLLTSVGKCGQRAFDAVRGKAA